ncbi:energy-coupling factor transporter ATPase [Alkalibacillus haloalkaliphilus]|uniref:energy-coupling factor transporter ATPase n=1 Tax=Alkalibacillus haloalkaliphilus TaxID=94136 RepID=UPI002936B22A|nr:energy-coupling factor transporter ATPase [Alkalibacillus haloalkaliphilus]MDV2582640.1 energy-coupling factor transporter ATPase [Alkalibacillus haloalkaliphilus]
MDIIFENVNYTYQPNTPFSHQALKDISLEIKSGSFVAIVGHTGSGKSTLLQHLNALLQPTSGRLVLGNVELPGAHHEQIKSIRQRVGLLFQYPEHQLFEETVKKELLFGPKNFGFDLKQVETELNDSLQEVGLEESVLNRSPFELSGGQMKRVALASMLLVKPQVLVLDEPTAGLDPLGQTKMMQLFKSLHENKQHTVVLVTHNMDDAMRYAEKVIVLNQGTVECVKSPSELIHERDRLKAIGLDVPEPVEFVEYMKARLEVLWEEEDINEQTISRTLVKHLKGGATS